MENSGGISQDFVGTRKGDYEILALLGTGGMGQVFKVRNVYSERIEAMKVLLPNLADQKNLADRFMREIKVLAGLHHPNIAELRTALTINNQLVMIMEYVEGATLAARIQQGAIPYGQALGYIDQVLSALGYAHGQHIIHRDIKPSNMMLTPAGVVKLMDFGIAQRGDQGELTKTNTTVGSFAYMSPEQIKGEPVDARSDLYSVGVSLYEMVTGQRPFPADTAFSAMQAHLQTPARPPVELRPDLPLALSQLIIMSVSKDPAARFQTADAFAGAIHAVTPKVTETVAAIPTVAPVAAAASGTTAGGRSGVAATSGVAAAAATGAAASPAVDVARSSHRGLYIALGAAIVVVVLLAAAIVPRHARTEALKERNVESVSASNPAPTTVPDTTTSTPANSPTAALNSPEASAATPTASTPASILPPRPAHTAPKQPVPDTQATSTAQPATDSATTAPTIDPAQLQALSLENDQLSGRAAAVSASLDNLQKQQAAQGLGLRGDIVASQQRMQNYMSKAQAAIQTQDTASARKYLDLASVEVEKLEKFLGR